MPDQNSPDYSMNANSHRSLWWHTTPSSSNKPLAESLRARAEPHAREHSIFREKDYLLEPNYILLHQRANHLPAIAPSLSVVLTSAHSASNG